MLKTVKCVCGTKTTVNTEKHVFRPKWCRNCRRPIDNLHPKLRVFSVFQMRKEERHKQTRERFINRLLARRIPLSKILRILDPQLPRNPKERENVG